MKMPIGDVLVQSAAGRDDQIFDAFYRRSPSADVSSPSVSPALILSSSKSAKFICEDPGSTRTVAVQLRIYPDATPSDVSVAPARVPGSDQDEASRSPVETYPSSPEVLS
jgi:hypothetical protein